MSDAQINSFLCGGLFWAITSIILAVVVYKIQIEPMKKRRK